MTDAAGATFDLDLHGLVRLRVTGAHPADAAAVARQLGTAPTSPAGEPDIRIRFVDALEARAPLRYVGLDDAAFTGDAFLVLRGRHKAGVRVELPLADIGSCPEIVCERGAAEVPLLVALVNVTLVGKGVLPLHASAFVHEGRGIVTTGWSKGGKTEALLAFAAAGASYVGDEWVHVLPDGSVVGLVEPVRVWSWHLRALPGLAARLRAAERARLALLDAAGHGLAAVHRARPSTTLRRVERLVAGQAHLDVEPARLFGADGSEPVAVDRIFWMVSDDSAGVEVHPVDGGAVAARMRASLEHERADLRTRYQQWLYAFPDRRSRLLDEVGDREAVLLRRAFAGRPTFAVHHPYPVALADLHAAMAPHCR